MAPEGVLTVAVFLMVSSGVLLAFTLVGGRRTRLEARLDDLSGKAGEAPADQGSVAQIARTALPRMGTPLMPSDEEERTALKTRLIHAGYYGRQSILLFLGVKMLLMVGPALAGLAAAALGLVPGDIGVLTGGLLGIFGMIGPSFWLDKAKAARQTNFRRALPDALDVLIVCMEGGLSLPGSLRRVANELRSAHPTLATELAIVEREIQLGRSPGEALQQMGLRTDLEEVRSLASVVTQSERFGASLVKSLRVHAESLRLKRRHQAEEMAQRAAVKVLMPTLLFIFPAVFVVILGPAVFQIMRFFSETNR
jgi:tight adherence protein C